MPECGRRPVSRGSYRRCRISWPRWYDTRDGNGDIYLRRLDAGRHSDWPGAAADGEPRGIVRGEPRARGRCACVAWYDKTAEGGADGEAGRVGSRRWKVVAPRDRRRHQESRSSDSDGRDFLRLDSIGCRRRRGGVGRVVGRSGTPMARTRTRLALQARRPGTSTPPTDRRLAWVVYRCRRTRPARRVVPRPCRRTSRSFASRATTGWPRNTRTWQMRTPRDVRSPGTTRGTAIRGVSFQSRVTTELRGEIDDRARASRPDERGVDRRVCGLEWRTRRPGLVGRYPWAARDLLPVIRPAGRPEGDVHRVTRTGASSLIPAIRAWRGGFALAWNEYTPPLDGAHEGHGGRSHIAVALIP